MKTYSRMVLIVCLFAITAGTGSTRAASSPHAEGYCRRDRSHSDVPSGNDLLR
jgi:hypothetical protein